MTDKEEKTIEEILSFIKAVFPDTSYKISNIGGRSDIPSPYDIIEFRVNHEDRSFSVLLHTGKFTELKYFPENREKIIETISIHLTMDLIYGIYNERRAKA